MAAADEAALQNCLSHDDFSFLFDCGCACPLHMTNRDEVLEAVWLHATYFSIQAELSQLRAGLTEVLNFSQLLSASQAAVLKLLSAAERHEVTMDQLLELFVPRFSEDGSNLRIKEEALMHNFCQMLEECEDQTVHFKCSDVLIFVTGASTIPPLGLLPTPAIVFSSHAGLPTASTCSNELHIPYSLIDYGRFSEAFDLAIRGCQGFGNI